MLYRFLLLSSLMCTLICMQTALSMQYNHNAVNNAQSIHTLYTETHKAWKLIQKHNLHTTTAAADELLLVLDAKEPLIEKEFQELHQKSSNVDKLYALLNHLSCNTLGQWMSSNNHDPINIAIAEYQAINTIKQEIITLKKNN